MPAIFWYLIVMLGVILVWFLALKRPVYEAVFISFLVLLGITGSFGNVLQYIDEAMSTQLLYSMVAFVVMSILLTKTKIIDGCIAIILSLLGRFSGGAGYVSVVASAFMGALSGSGPGNVMATGAITIPAMKKSGFPAELAANIESNASCLGNLIPPSSNILAALAALTGVYGDIITQGQFWGILWGISAWFILQRIVMVYGFCKFYKVKPIPKEELPRLRDALRQGWRGIFLPILILLPFILDTMFKDTFFTARLGAAGAKSLSSAMLIFIPGITCLFAVLVHRNKKEVTPHAMAKMFANGIKTIVPTVCVCILGYMIGALFNDLRVEEELIQFVTSVHFGRFGMVVFICIFACVIGMFIPGTAMISVFGGVFIASLVAVGVDPVLAAAMLPCICGVMSHITPPLGLCMYAGMTLAESDFGKTFKNNLWWISAQFILQILVLMGWLPVPGL